MNAFLSNPTRALRELDRADCATRHGLGRFFRLSWPQIEPGSEYVHGWHLDALADHLAAVTEGEITRLLINVPPGTMKALEVSTPVLTLDGWKAHGDLRAGDFVYAPNGRPIRVLGVTPHVVEDAFEVAFDDGATVVAGGAHLWEIEREHVDAQSHWRRDRRRAVVPTTDLLSADGVRGSYARPDRIAICDPIWAPRQFLLVDPYLLGVWLGDGGTDSGTIFAAEQDVAHFGQLGDVRLARQGAADAQPFYRIRVPGLQTKLRVLGLLGAKRVPDCYLRGSYDQRLALLQGLMDTDGHAAGSCIFTSANEQLARAVQFLANSIGAKAYLRSRFTKLDGRLYGPHYAITFRPPPGVEVFRLARKQAKVTPAKSDRLCRRYVQRVDPLGPRVVNCISVEGGLYLAGRDLIATHNSLAVGVFWPAWEWGPRGLPHYRYVGASHSEDLSIRDNMRMRRVVESDWFQDRWRVRLARDQNEKRKFENASTGFRAAVSATAMTGHRGNRVIYDDPHSVEGAISDKKRPTVLRIFAETVTTRLNDPERSAIIVVMQRLHEMDLSGHILASDLGYEHLCLPMEFEPGRRCRTSIGFEDPRTEAGELLFEQRFPRAVVERDKRAMGAIATAGQFQQRPTPRGGGMFPIDEFRIVEAPPAPDRIKATVRYWDKAGTDAQKSGATAQTAGVLMHYLHDGSFVVGDVQFGQWAALERERRIKQTAEIDGRRIKVYVEQEPGSGGKESAEATIRNLAGFSVYADRPTGDKAVRAEPYAAQVQGGNVSIVRAPWNLPFLHEHEAFPVGATKDMVDAAAAALNILTGAKNGSATTAPVQGLY